MPVPSALLILNNPGDDDDDNSGSAFEIVNGKGAQPKAEEDASEGTPKAKAKITTEAITAAYEASRNGNPKAFADAFEGAVRSMIGDEIHKALKERDS